MRARRRNSADIGIAKNDDERIAISEALNLIQADQLINNNDVVVITPNWVQQQPPQTGVVVGTESLREFIRFAKKIIHVELSSQQVPVKKIQHKL